MTTATSDDDLVRDARSPGRTLSLTFDDGPHPENTPALLRVLGRHSVTAVFFVCGAEVAEHPEIVRETAALGHVLGNHTMHHDDLETWPAHRVEADLRATNAAVEAAAPGTPIPYFRAPYLRWGDSRQVAHDLGMRRVDCRFHVADWEPQTADALYERLVAGAEPGAVILLHDGGGDRTATVEAVDRFIPEMRSRGWEFDLP
ncbi:polysaccharide deacetylase family protein [Cellulomonas sp. URHB0016]